MVRRDLRHCGPSGLFAARPGLVLPLNMDDILGTRICLLAIDRSDFIGGKPSLDPFGLFRSKRWFDRGHIVVDGAVVGPLVVSPVEGGLEVEWDVGIAREERYRDHGQSRLELERVDKEVLEMIKAMDAHMVIKRSGLRYRQVKWYSRRVRPGSEKIDLDQVDLGQQCLLLFGQVEVAAVVSWCFVGGAEDLEDRDDDVLGPLATMDFQVRLMERITHDRLDPDDDGLAGDGFGDGDASCVGITPAVGSCRAGSQDVHVRLDGCPMLKVQPDVLARPGIV